MDCRDQFGFMVAKSANRLKYTFAGLATLSLLFSCAPTLSGRVTGPQGEIVASPDARVNVSRLDQKDSTPVIVIVDEDGEFKAKSVAKGQYLVEVLVPGYRVASQRVDLDSSKKVDFTLTPLGKAIATPVGVNTDVNPSRGAGGANLTPPQL